MSYRFTVIRLLSLVCFVAPNVYANSDDTRFLREQTQRQIEQNTQSEQQLGIPFGTLLHEGQHYSIATTIQELEPALYIAINTGQWAALTDFISRYRLLAGARPALVAMAESLLARNAGDYGLALQRMERAKHLEPTDARISLELARLWFEDHQDKHAQLAFEQVLNAGLPEDAQALVQQYLNALEQRASWQGSAAFGWGHNSNITQTNGYQRCERYLPVLGLCAFERKMPAALASNMLNYEVSLQRRFNIRGNHNIQIRPISYGSYYATTNPNPNASVQDYSNNLAVLYVGYEYLNARQSFSLSPYVEHFWRNRAREHMAFGAQAEWRYHVTPRWQISNSLDYKQYRYSHAAKHYQSNHYQWQWGTSLSYMPSVYTNLYGGLNFSRKRYAIAQASNQDWSLRGGVYHRFGGQAGWFVNALVLYRINQHTAYDFFLGARRKDKQWLYSLNTGVSNWKILGLSPEIRLRHTVNHSNIAWAFDYKQTELGLMLRKQF